MDIGTMEAGRELDALIEDKIFNKKFHRTFTPDYSTDVAEAWQVVAYLNAWPREYAFSLSHTPAILHRGRPCFHVEFGGHFAAGETAPLAICRAALKAIEKETKEAL